MNIILFILSLLFDPEEQKAYNYEIGCGEIPARKEQK